MTVLNGSMASTTETLVRRLPKAELHIHIEGSLEAGMMLKVRTASGPVMLAELRASWLGDPSSCAEVM